MQRLVEYSDEDERADNRRRAIIRAGGGEDPGPRRMIFIPENLLEKILLEAKGIWYWKNIDRVDVMGNKMPPVLTVSGDFAQGNKDIKRLWTEYLARVPPKDRVICIEAEVGQLNWTQNQKADFIGMDSGNYARAKKELKEKLGIQ